ncbi:nucleotide-binding protein [Actinomadura barringtoniae]|uniref:nucleotide-binding protein n=1 Tax=Actinomadura barringtoniae TaxID=1427535 RepID=UPI0027DB4860|nr:AAA family ATPase [Actinomadura barringtoniae]
MTQHGRPVGAPPDPADATIPLDAYLGATDALTPDRLLRGRRAVPEHGWRRLVHRASRGRVHPPESAAEVRRRELIARVRTPVAGGHHRVAVLSLKGGVGKTTTAVGLGSALASIRGDRVIAVDANPDHGTLSEKVRMETPASVRDLLAEMASVPHPRYADVRAFTSQSISSRLEILASARDPELSKAFTDHDYRSAVRLLEHFYSICITDCGTGLLHSAMGAVLELADQVVLVTIPSVASARSASATLDWLEAHGHTRLARNAVVVLSSIRPGKGAGVDIEALRTHFDKRCQAVVTVPYDPHLAQDAEVDVELLQARTRDAFLTLAATVGDGFERR